MPLPKVKCKNCGREILLLTSQKHDGLCVRCVRAQYGMPPELVGYYGWFSEEQAELLGTVIYADSHGKEVEVSSVSSDEMGRPQFDDTKFIGCVVEFLRQGRGKSAWGEPAFSELDLFSRLMVINQHSQVQNAGKPRKNLLTLVNESGEDVLVWLVGPLQWAPLLENKESTLVHVPPGRYHIMLGWDKSPYQFFRGEEFEVLETPNSPSSLTITFRQMNEGGYKIQPILENEFADVLEQAVKLITGGNS